MEIAQKLSNGIKQYGLLNFLSLVTTRAGEKLGFYNDTYTLLTQDLRKTLPTKQLATGYTLKEFTAEDLDKLTGSWVSPEQIQAFRKRLMNPAQLGIGIYSDANQELAYFFWLSYDNIEFPDRYNAFHSLRLGPDEAYLFDGFCNPSYRGLGFHGVAAIYLMEKAQQAGKKKAVTIILSINKAALISQQKVGFRPSQEIRFKGYKTRVSSTVRTL